jgi:hypothetical protein
MDSVIKVLAIVVAGLIGLAGWNFFALTMTKNVLLDMPSMEAAGEYFDMQQEAFKKYPGKDPFEAMSRYSQDLAAEKLSEAETPEAKAKVAAEIFYGFWMTQGRGRAEFCAETGVDITPFGEAFEKRNARQLKKALALMGADKKVEDKLWKKYRATILSRIGFEMLYIKGYGVPSSHKEACEEVLAKRHLFLDRIDFRVALPTLNHALVSYSASSTDDTGE